MLPVFDRWQRTRALGEHPIVLVSDLPEMVPHLVAVDTLRPAVGQPFYVVRLPLRELERP